MAHSNQVSNSSGTTLTMTTLSSAFDRRGTPPPLSERPVGCANTPRAPAMCHRGKFVPPVCGARLRRVNPPTPNTAFSCVRLHNGTKDVVAPPGSAFFLAIKIAAQSINVKNFAIFYAQALEGAQVQDTCATSHAIVGIMLTVSRLHY